MMGVAGVSGDWDVGGAGVRVAVDEALGEVDGGSISELGSPPEEEEDVDVSSLLLKAVKYTMTPATAAIIMVRKTVAIQTTFVDRIMVGMAPY